MPSTLLSSISSVAALLKSQRDCRIVFDPPTEGPTSGAFTAWQDSTLDPRIVGAMQSKLQDGLFTHQHAAIEQVLRGHHTVVATRTSSGKTLTFALPAIDALCKDSNATSLFLHPQKALANDQLLKLKDLAGEIEPLRFALGEQPHLISRYDGASDQDDKKGIRDQVQILLTNPDMLNLGILQYHGTHWQRFFANLKIVAIDECHEYRSVFGTGVAHVLRRLRQICQFHGSKPTFVASSATIAEPQQHLKRLVGEPFTSIGADQDGSRQGRRKFWMVTGTDHHYDIGLKLATRMANQGLSVLVFCPSRTTAERLLSQLRRHDGSYEDHVAVYRSGLKNDQREAIEHGLRDKTKRLVFSTTALELGIDIGQLDVVLCIGLPGSMMSLWQRAGRVGRAGREGAIILVPGNSPIETHYIHHPEEFFARENEPISLNLSNVRLACQHYACARDEVGGDESKMKLATLGDMAQRIHALRQQGKLKRHEFFNTDPHGEVNLRNSCGKNFNIVDGNDELGEISAFHMLRETPRNAIYRHGGQTYRVQDIIRGKHLVRVRRELTRNESFPYIHKDIAIRTVLKTAEYSVVRLATVRIEVSEYLQSLTERDRSGNMIQTWPGSGGMPTHKLPTEGTMLALKPVLEATLRKQLRCHFEPAVRSCERLLFGLFPTISGPCDSQDFSSGVTKLATGEAAIVLYDMVYDGVELTQIALDHMPQLIANTIDRVSNCLCTDDKGCIRCVVDPKQDQPASKTATLICLKAIRSVLNRETPEIKTFTATLEDQLSCPLPILCSVCGHTISIQSKFCSECGTPITETKS